LDHNDTSVAKPITAVIPATPTKTSGQCDLAPDRTDVSAPAARAGAAAIFPPAGMQRFHCSRKYHIRRFTGKTKPPG